MTAKYTPKHLADAAREQDQRAVFLVLQIQLRFGLDQPSVIGGLQQLARLVPEAEGAPA